MFLPRRVSSDDRFVYVRRGSRTCRKLVSPPAAHPCARFMHAGSGVGTPTRIREPGDHRGGEGADQPRRAGAVYRLFCGRNRGFFGWSQQAGESKHIEDRSDELTVCSSHLTRFGEDQSIDLRAT